MIRRTIVINAISARSEMMVRLKLVILVYFDEMVVSVVAVNNFSQIIVQNINY